MADKILLPNGCTMSQPSVNPKNWKDGGRELLKKNWQIQFYFYDPKFAQDYPYGKLIPVRGMNSFKTLKDRRKITQMIIDDEIAMCLQGYNHFTKSIIGENDIIDYEIEPITPFIKALWKTTELMNVAKDTMEGIKVTIRHIEKASQKLRLHKKPINEIQRRHLKMCLDFVEKSNKKESNYRYNKNRSHLHSLFRTLVEYETIEANIVRDISKRVVEKNERELLSAHDFKMVREFLKNESPEFYRYVMIFFFSGSRSSELLSVQKKHVDINNSEYRILIKKGKQYVWEKKPIILPAIQFWKEIYALCEDEEHYLFSHYFLPNEKRAFNKIATRYWQRHVKKKLGVTADFYALKHLFLDLIDEQNSFDFDASKSIASHRSGRTTDIYRVNKKKRELEALKQINVNL